MNTEQEKMNSYKTNVEKNEGEQDKMTIGGKIWFGVRCILCGVATLFWLWKSVMTVISVFAAVFGVWARMFIGNNPEWGFIEAYLMFLVLSALDVVVAWLMFKLVKWIAPVKKGEE